MPLVRIPTETGAILYDPSRVDHPRSDDFEPQALTAAGRIAGSATGRGSVWFTSVPGAETRWVLRHYRRGGLVARLSADRYLWCGEAATRSFRELTLLAQLEQLGLPAVRPVAARYVRSGALYRADLLTVAAGGVRTLAAALGSGLSSSAWGAVGSTIRVFHDAGICHADLNAHNVLLGSSDKVTLVDFDRGRERAPGAWQAGNLQRLFRSLSKLCAAGAGTFGAIERRELQSGYDAPRKAPPR